MSSGDRDWEVGGSWGPMVLESRSRTGGRGGGGREFRF